MQGGGFTLDVQIGHAHEQKPASSGTTTLEPATPIKP